MTASRFLHARSPLTWVLGVAMTIFLALGLRTFFFPASAAAFYGIPTGSLEALAFVQAYGARNVAISLIAFSLLAQDARNGIAALLCGAALIAALDFWIVISHAGTGPALKHIVYVVVLSGLALVTMRGGRSSEALPGMTTV